MFWSRSNLNWTELSALNYSNRLSLVSYITKVSLIGRRNSKSIICQNIYIILLSQYFCVNLYRDCEFKMTPLPVQQDDLCDIIMYHNPNSEQHHKTDKIQNNSNTQTQIQQKGYVNTPLSRSFLLSSWVSSNVNGKHCIYKVEHNHLSSVLLR